LSIPPTLTLLPLPEYLSNPSDGSRYQGTCKFSQLVNFIPAGQGAIPIMGVVQPIFLWDIYAHLCGEQREIILGTPPNGRAAQSTQLEVFTTWQEYQNDFLDSRRKGPGDTAPTYWPTDLDAGPELFADSAPWMAIEIRDDEIEDLCRQAPAFLSQFSSGGTETVPSEAHVTSLSFDVAVTRLVRPWFHPEIFSDRRWKWQGLHEGLSDGADPPKGSLPAYPTAVILARHAHPKVSNIQSDSDTAQTQMLRLRQDIARLPFALPAVTLKLPADAAKSGPENEIRLCLAVHTQMIRRPLPLPVALPVAAPTATPLVLAARTGPPPLRTATLAGLRTVTLPSFAHSPSLPSGLANAITSLKEGETDSDACHDPGTGSEPELDTDLFADAQILAFLSTRVPRSPDPDPALQF
jgi:hypothetical protein